MVVISEEKWSDFMTCYKGCHVAERLTDMHCVRWKRLWCEQQPSAKQQAAIWQLPKPRWSELMMWQRKGLIEVLIETDEDIYMHIHIATRTNFYKEMSRYGKAAKHALLLVY